MFSKCDYHIYWSVGCWIVDDLSDVEVNFWSWADDIRLPIVDKSEQTGILTLVTLLLTQLRPFNINSTYKLPNLEI